MNNTQGTSAQPRPGRPVAITLEVGSSLANRTGSWRAERPVYVSRVPPYALACPAGEDPQSWLFAAEEADYQTAWQRIVEANTHNGWRGPGSYFAVPAESWAESWVHCMTPYPWRSDYVQIPCPYVQAALTNTPFPPLPPQPSTAARVPAAPISPAQAAE